MGVKADDFAQAFGAIARLTIHGVLITLPHKTTVVGMLDEVSTAVKVAGSCNAVKRAWDGRLIGDMFDGGGFVRGVLREDRAPKGARVPKSGARFGHNML